MEKAPVPLTTAGRSASSGVSRTAFGDGTELARLDDRPGHRAYHRGRIDERMIEVQNPNDLTEGINPSAGSEMPPPRPGNLWGGRELGLDDREVGRRVMSQPARSL
jgi:hypothetical protein